ncbi:MAG: molybdate ABC transporter substrate-binding protein [Chloroflexi bacterium]|nr:molybdate ABC transporter substrate-binding protein [Chloroflexota bacterium]MDA1174586.1 molybdate ABC transporter substrate-binding protein [Chloroflexota bacterium]
MRAWHAVLLILALVTVSGCAGERAPSITAGAASSLQPLLNSIKPGFEEESGITLHITYSASGALARQIEQGAPIDVFVSAGAQYIDELSAGSFLRQDSLAAIAYGQLVLIRPEQDSGEIRSFADAERIAIANPETAPYGAAAKSLLESSGLWDDVEPRIVYAESALQAYQFAKAGEVDYAFVPLPLVRIPADGITYGDHVAAGLRGLPTVDYLAAVATSTDEEEGARAFIDYLAAPEVQAKLHEFGYNSILGPR